MLNSFQLKLLKFTKNEPNKNKKPLQAHHVTTKTGQKKQKFQTKTAGTPCRVKLVSFLVR